MIRDRQYIEYIYELNECICRKLFLFSLPYGMVWWLVSLTAALNKLFIRSNFLSPAPSILYTHVPDCACSLCISTNKFGLQPVRQQIHNTWTRLCLTWPKICYSWTRIQLFWRPKIHYFPDKHKQELQGAYWSLFSFLRVLLPISHTYTD